ncbi:unnamed protein product [Boreogadus saida]
MIDLVGLAAASRRHQEEPVTARTSIVKDLHKGPPGSGHGEQDTEPGPPGQRSHRAISASCPIHNISRTELAGDTAVGLTTKAFALIRQASQVREEA